MQVNSISSNANINSTRKNSGSVGGDGSFQSYLGESQELDAIFQKASQKYGVDVNLLKAVARVESNFRPNVVSSAGAVGIMQLMPRTAKGLGVKNSYDPEQNIMGGAKLLSQLIDKYDGDLETALAGYNAGSGNVKKYGGVPPWKSVHKYINKVLGFYKESGPVSATTSNHTTTPVKNTPQVSTTPSTNTAISNGEMTNAYYQAGATSTVDQLTAMLDVLNITSESTQSELDTVFSYEKYLKFIELYFKEQEEEKKEETEDNRFIKSSTQLQISPSVSNMLRGI